MGQDDDDEAEQLSPRSVVHNHYTQSRNGNGNSLALKLFIGLSGALLVILVGMQGFMWRSQIDFQNAVIDRLARVETKLQALENDRP
jgi:hypothetical protein